MPVVPLLWLPYEFQMHPEPTLKWLVFRGLLPFGGGVVVFVLTNIFSAFTASSGHVDTPAPISRAVDPFSWLFGSVTLGCAALGDAWGIRASSSELMQWADLSEIFVVGVLIAYGLGVHRRALMQPGEYKPRAALAATALSVAVAMVGDAHHMGAILRDRDQAQHSGHPG
jgi:hypothetical protein